MKKIIAILMTLALLLPAAAWACESSVLTVKTEAKASYVYNDPSWWPLTEDCRIAGIKDYGEYMWHAPVQYADSQYVAGWLDNGWARMNWYVRTVTIGCQIIGLKQLNNVTIEIFPEYADIALAVVKNLLGEETELSANAIVACATWWDGDYAALITHPSYSDRFQVGWAHFNGQDDDKTPLCLGHFDSELRFGLMCGWWIPEPEPEQPEEEPTPVQTDFNGNTTATDTANAGATANANASANAGAYVNVNNSGTVDNSGDGCWRNNVTVQINLFSIIKQGIKILKECTEQ